MNKRELNPEQIADIERLEKIWIYQKEAQKIKQIDLAKAMGLSQTAVNGYLKGRWALNAKAATDFARELHCKVSDFSPSLQSEIDELSIFSSNNAEKTLQLIKMLNTNPDWPFSSVNPEDIKALSVQDRLKMEGLLQGLLIQLKRA